MIERFGAELFQLDIATLEVFATCNEWRFYTEPEDRMIFGQLSKEEITLFNQHLVNSDIDRCEIGGLVIGLMAHAKPEDVIRAVINNHPMIDTLARSKYSSTPGLTSYPHDIFSAFELVKPDLTLPKQLLSNPQVVVDYLFSISMRKKMRFISSVKLKLVSVVDFEAMKSAIQNEALQKYLHIVSNELIKQYPALSPTTEGFDVEKLLHPQ